MRQCKDSMVPIRTNINAMKELHAKIITEVSQTKSKGGREWARRCAGVGEGILLLIGTQFSNLYKIKEAASVCVLEDARMHTCTCAHTLVGPCACLCACVHERMCMCVCEVCVCACVCVCVCVMYMWIIMMCYARGDVAELCRLPLPLPPLTGTHPCCSLCRVL